MVELGAGPNPSPSADLDLNERLGTANWYREDEVACVEQLEKRCGTVIVKPTTDGRSAALFEHAGEFCVVTAPTDHQALYSALWNVSQR